MKTFIAFVLVILTSVTMASAQTVTGFAEGQFQFVGDNTSKTLDVAMTTPIKNGWAIETWVLKTDGWGEVYVGVSKSLAPWIAVTGQVGIEQADSPWRVAGTLWMGNANNSALLIVEDGGSGLWHKLVVNHKLTKNFGAGVMSQRFVGTGPYAEVVLGKAKIWVTVPLAGGTGALVGLRMGF